MSSRKIRIVSFGIVPALLASTAWAVPFVPCNVFWAAGPWACCGAAFNVDGVVFATRGYRFVPGGPAMGGGNAAIQPAPGLGAGQAMRLTAVNVAPNIAAFAPAGVFVVTFDYWNLGGNINLRVNGVQAVAPSFMAIPGGLFPGVAIAVAPPVAPGVAGTVTLTALPGTMITTLQIGGQNMIIDNINFFRIR